jgi:hypothetical protein
MSEATQSPVQNLEELEAAVTAPDDTGDFGTTDGHAPITPEKAGNGGDVITTDGHAPIAPPRGDS